MAYHKSAKKRVLRNEARRQVNRARVSRLRTFLKKVEAAIAGGDAAAAQGALRAAQPEIMRGAGTGVIHKNTARRKLSRLSARIKALGG
ncbi:MAG TPA: 30S ribosomal protein S20 [Alphaproteobacteria bacterium]